MCDNFWRMSTLSDYIKSEPDRPMREWAEMFGISRPYLIALADGTRTPSLAVAQRIAEQTRGAVPLSSWPTLAAVARAFNQTSPEDAA
jgi:hypothetical protein